MRPRHPPHPRRGPPAGRQVRAHAGNQEGVATVELALIATPLLVAVLLLVVAAGRLLAAQTALGGLTRDAARVAVTATSAGHAVQLATQQAQRSAADAGLDPTRLAVRVDPAGYVRGGHLTVTASYRLALLGGLDAGWPATTLTDTHVELIDPHLSR